MKQLICEMCGGSDLIKQDGVFVCQHCGTKYSVEEAKKMMLEGTVQVEGNISIQGPVKVVNAQFESKFQIAKMWENKFFSDGPKSVEYGNLKGYDAVLRYYDDAVDAGGACESKLWVAVSEFYVKGNIAGLKDGSRFLKTRKGFVEGYTMAIDKAIDLCDSDEQKQMLLKTKNDTIAYLDKELLNYKEKGNSGCYVATCVYGSYDCPQVWTLRRYRDKTLASTWYGRVFIHIYYAISPTIVKYFGNTQWFKNFWKSKLNKMVSNLRAKGMEDTPYQDKEWR